MKFRFRRLCVALLAVIAFASSLPASALANDTALSEDDAGGAEEVSQQLKTRRFRFTYAAKITALEPGTKARVWVPVAPTNDDQDVEIVNIGAPGVSRQTTERKHGNQLLYIEAQADQQGEIPFSIEYVVVRRAITRQSSPAMQVRREQFLVGSSKMPVDGSVAKRFFSDSPPSGPTLHVARQLYDRVDLHMTYDKSGEGWGQGDVLWACDSKRGNCSDFHSVFIALCRDLEIPAKFEIGFPLPPEEGKGEIAGYHCWAKFLDRDRWVGVDISEADKHPEMKDFLFGQLPADRVMLSTERDLILEPRQSGAPVNFLIYPYAEVNGKPYNNQTRHFSFEDLPVE